VNNSDEIRKKFKTVLLEEITNQYQDLDTPARSDAESSLEMGDKLSPSRREQPNRPSRSRIDRREDRAAFEADRTPGEEANLDTDPMGVDVSDAEAKVVEALYRQVEEAGDMVDRLNDPSSENSLNRFLANNERPNSLLAGASDKLGKQIVKAAVAISTVKEELRAIIAREPAIKRRLSETSPSTTA
jgi:hypothetical protein